MSYDAITIDTQVVRENGSKLDSGIIGQLSQYKDGLVKFVLSEVTVHEIHKALKENAKKSRDSLTEAIRLGSANRHIKPDALAKITAIQDAMLEPDKHATQQITEFSTATSAGLIQADLADMQSILKRYFRNEPPFANKGKKNEFPDAIALLSLENWAKENGKKILAVSKDKDWKTFAKDCEHIDVVEDLGEAMALLNEQTKTTVPNARAVLEAIKTENEGTLSTFETSLGSAVESVFPHLEFDSSMPGEDENISLTLVKYEVVGLDDGTTEIDVVRIGKTSFAFTVSALITVEVDAEINFYIRDWIDKDIVPMGSTSIKREKELQASVLIECGIVSGDLDHEFSTAFEIKNVELLNMPNSIDVGYIEHSLADDDYDFDIEALRDLD